MARPKVAPTIRFWNRIDKSSGHGPNGTCWPWDSGRDKDGYGLFKADGKHGHATRWLWANIHGPIPQGLCVLHKCDNPPCVNPDHLFLGTNAENTADRVRKGRTRGTFRKGKAHPGAVLSEQAIYEIRDLHSKGVLQCVIARRLGVDPSTISNVIRRVNWVHI